MKHLVLEAFFETRNGYSPDRVIAGPVLNAEFLAACRRKAVAMSDTEINRTLLNARKASDLKNLSSVRTVIRDQADFRYASEVAIRFLERRDGISLDLVLCDPQKAVEFDQIASAISPGRTALEYRWAALSLRKKRQLRPELVSRVVERTRVTRFKIAADLSIDDVPAEQGVYLLQTSGQCLYVGEADNLRKRLAKHLDHSDRKGLAHWFWQHGFDDLHLELHVLPRGTAIRTRKALEASLIHSSRPLLNILGASENG
jgi:site-specific DNA-methyltransferase (adenine-specific)